MLGSGEKYRVPYGPLNLIFVSACCCSAAYKGVDRVGRLSLLGSPSASLPDLVTTLITLNHKSEL